MPATLPETRYLSQFDRRTLELIVDRYGVPVDELCGIIHKLEARIREVEHRASILEDETISL